MMFGRLSLRYRIALVIFLLEACMLAVVLSVTLNQSRHTAVEFDADSQEASLSLLSNLSFTALLTGEYSDYQLYIGDVEKMPSIKRIMLADFRERVVADSSAVDVGRMLSKALPSSQAGWQVQQIQSAAGPLGILAVEFSNEALTAAHERTRNLALFLAISGMLIIALVGLITGFALTRRLQTVADAVIRFTKGDMEARSHLRGHDEVARLSHNVDKMAEAVVNQRKEMAREIEERKRSEEALRESRVILRQILDTLLHAVFWKDTDGIYLGCNRVFAKAVGLTDPEDIVGRTDADLPWPQEEYESGKMVERLVVSDKTPQRHIVELPSDSRGQRAWIDMTKVPLIDDSGKVYGILGVYEDITERKNAEKEWQKLEARLNQSQKMEAIGTLAGGIAHDFNNILSAILGYTELAREDAPPGSKYADDLIKVLEAGYRARDLVQQILAFSRQSKVERIPIQLRSIIKEALKIIRSSLPTTIEIREKYEENCGMVLADATQIHQILMNLCTNALHAMEKKGGTLDIELKCVRIDRENRPPAVSMDPGEYVELIVSDTGIGIRPEMLDRIFDPYFTTKELGKGTGLGLAIIHGIVTDYGGTITVDSSPGNGSVFHVYFPVVEQENLPKEEESLEMFHGKEKVLLVDDEEILAQMGQDMLERLGYSVTVRQNSLDALSTFQNCADDFDVVITDQTMPGMTGSDLARRMLRIRPDIPIILLTGYSNLVDEKSAKAIGIKEFILKPVTKSSMARCIRKVLDGS